MHPHYAYGELDASMASPNQLNPEPYTLYPEPYQPPTPVPWTLKPAAGAGCGHGVAQPV